jgi:hypothetical protein
MSFKEKDKTDVEDANLHLIVLLNILIEKFEYLEEQGYLFGSLKMFAKNAKNKFENFISKVFRIQDTIEGQTAIEATNKLLVMQERVELALQNQYILTVDERRRRTRKILKVMFLDQYKEMGLHKSMPAPLLNELRRKAVRVSMQEMKDKNLFNF